MIALAEWLKQNFYLAQILGGGALVLAFWWFAKPSAPESQFKVREADRVDRKPATGESLAEAKLKIKKPLELSGIRLDRPPHELLGVSIGATEKEIRSAHREMMKRYHPDQVARPGTQAWADATRIAEALNHAKDSMIARLKR